MYQYWRDNRLKHICHVLYFCINYCSLFLFSVTSCPLSCFPPLWLSWSVSPAPDYPPVCSVHVIPSYVSSVFPAQLCSMSYHSSCIEVLVFPSLFVSFTPAFCPLCSSCSLFPRAWFHCLLVFLYFMFLYLDISSLKLTFCFNLPAFTCLEFNTILKK